MSGDNFHGDQPPIFYSKAGQRTLQNTMCEASVAMDEIKESRWQNTNYVLEIESMFVQSRWRNDSPLRE